MESFIHVLMKLSPCEILSPCICSIMSVDVYLLQKRYNWHVQFSAYCSVWQIVLTTVASHQYWSTFISDVHQHIWLYHYIKMDIFTCDKEMDDDTIAAINLISRPDYLKRGLLGKMVIFQSHKRREVEIYFKFPMRENHLLWLVITNLQTLVGMLSNLVCIISQFEIFISNIWKLMIKESKFAILQIDFALINQLHMSMNLLPDFCSVWFRY